MLSKATKPIRRTLAAMFCGAAILCGLLAPEVQGQQIDFEKEILPIFEEHCFECHGNGNGKGGLSLESVAKIQMGGHSGSPIFTPKASESELSLRIKSLAEGYRMPKDGEPLSQAKISKISKWLFQNRRLPAVKPQTPPIAQTPAPSVPKVVPPRLIDEVPISERPLASPPPKMPPPSNEVRSGDGRSATIVESAETSAGVLRDYDISPLMLVIASTALITAFLCWAFYRAKLAYSRKTRRRIQNNEDLKFAYSASAIGAFSAVLLVGLVILYLRVSQLTLENELLRSLEESPVTQTTKTSYVSTAAIVSVNADNLPLPPHPMHPPRLGGKYFRGNDERDESLFNGGFYRTATIDLNLVDESGKRYRWGDDVETAIFVEIEIQRSANATRELFTNRIAKLSSIDHYSQKPAGVEEKLKFEVLKEEELWSVKVPLPAVPDQIGRKRLEGMVYLMYGTQPSEAQLPRPHFAIKYDLRFDGDDPSSPTISSDSVLWMGSMYTLNNRVLVPNAEQVLLDRWFDWRPIPEIDVKPSSDAKLLGTNEHLRP